MNADTTLSFSRMRESRPFNREPREPRENDHEIVRRFHRFAQIMSLRGTQRRGNPDWELRTDNCASTAEDAEGRGGQTGYRLLAADYYLPTTEGTEGTEKIINMSLRAQRGNLGCQLCFNRRGR